MVKVNQSYHFLAPLLGLKNFDNVINSYLLYKNSEDEFKFNLFLLCSKKDESLEKSNIFVKIEEESNDNTEILYKVVVPRVFFKEYDLFLAGKYSEYSKEAKKILCNHASKGLNKKPEDTKMYSILYRTEGRKKQIEEALDVKLNKDAEYASILNINKEFYDGKRI